MKMSILNRWLIVIFAIISLLLTSRSLLAELTVDELINLADQGNAEASYTLGQMYNFGRGVELDYKEAVKWFKKAAEIGLPQAQYNLANKYYYGQGVNQDYKKAVYWYRKSAEQGIPQAQNNLGLRYANGEGVERNYKEAVKWLKRAAEQGISQAVNVLEDLCRRMPELCEIKLGKTQHKLDSLRRLSTTTGSMNNDENINITSIINNAIDNTKNADSYCSYTELIEIAVSGLENKNTLMVEWRLDYKKPGNFLVSQYITESDSSKLIDQWISIDNASYQNAGVWSRSEDRRHWELNRFLLVDSFLKMLRQESIEKHEIYFYDNYKYLTVWYIIDSSNDIIEFVNRLFGETAKISNKYYITIWINTDLNYISKGTITVRGLVDNGKNIDIEISQVYTSYNENIQIKLPKGLDGTSNFIFAPEVKHHN